MSRPMTDATWLQGADGPPAARTEPSTLAEEHALLMREVAKRERAVLEETSRGRLPQPELQELLKYLHLEVLRQATDEQWLLFRSDHGDPAALAQLRRDHLDLRLAIDVLSGSAAATGTDARTLTPSQLAATTRDVLIQVERYFVDGEQLLANAGDAAPAAALIGGRPHEWYEVTNGPVIDLDVLDRPHGIDAVFDRLVRLAPGEHVELRSGLHDPSPLWQRLASFDPGGYGIVYFESGRDNWRVEITRRPNDWAPHPLA
jgi:uncharacterized protein (DUF2249 family)